LPEEQTYSRWKVVHTDADEPDADGLVSFHVALQAESGQVFICTSSGPGIAEAKLFVNALVAAAHHLARKCGGAVPAAQSLTIN
jgi:hypothetical protein